jgi:Xaa-Pro aminopeptidase
MVQKQRLAKLRALLAQHDTEALLVTHAINRKYLSGFTGSSGALLITADKALLYSDFRYRTQAPEQAPNFEFIEHQANMMDSIQETVHALHIHKLAFEPHEMSFESYSACASKLEGIELKPSGKWIEQLRMIKDESELVIMKEAAELADRTFQHIVGILKPGMKEQEIALEIEFYMRHHGAVSSSFETIVASGERSALPHGVASARKLQSGEYVKLDFGAYYQGYCSDITRTVMLGKPTDQHRHIYQIVREAQQAALEQIRPGMTGREADAIARNMIKDYGYGDLFGHGTGHGLGMEIHEVPRLSMTSDTVLEPGMTVTVEPGIYVVGFGGVRIEDDVVITRDGVDVLTHATKDFIVID